MVCRICLYSLDYWELESDLINFLVGDLVFQPRKTGVHQVYNNLITRYRSEYGPSDLKLSCYASETDIRKKNPKYTDSSYSDCAIFSYKLARVLAYFLPIELFFGRSDMYVCDGLIPHTIFPSKKIAIVHDLMVKIFPNNYPLLNRLYLTCWLYQLARADLIIAVSESTKIDIVRYLNIDANKIKVVYPGFEFPREPETDPEYVSGNLRIDRDYFLYIGDMRPNKNLLNALKAFKKFSESNESVFFYIAGNKSWDYTNLKKYVDENGLGDRVFFLGFISDEEKGQLYKNAKALIFVSLYEGFGIPIVEAASYGCPVITSNCSSMKEIARDCCLLVDPNDPALISQAMQSILDDNLSSAIREKQSRILSQYTWDASYEQFKRMLDI